MFGSRSMSHIAGQAKLHRMRHVVRMLVNMLPEEKRNTREVQELADAAQPPCICSRSMPSGSTTRTIRSN
jgi:hypothetical protein